MRDVKFLHAAICQGEESIIKPVPNFCFALPIIVVICNINTSGSVSGRKVSRGDSYRLIPANEQRMLTQSMNQAPGFCIGLKFIDLEVDCFIWFCHGEQLCNFEDEQQISRALYEVSSRYMQW